MNKQDLYAYLTEKNIPHEITEHGAVYNMDDLAAADLPYPEAEAKNLFVRDDKKQHYYLITVHGERRVNLKKFAKAQETRRLSFASAEDLLAILDLMPGSVSPVGLLHDTDRRVEFYLDDAFLQPPFRIGIHPNDNTATVWLNAHDLIALIKQSGHTVHIVSFP